MNNYDAVKKIVDASLSLIKPWDSRQCAEYGIVGYIKSMRTIDIRVPRQSGKTRCLIDMFFSENAILVHPPQCKLKIRHDLKKYVTSSPRYFMEQIRGRTDLYKIDYLLIDEPFNRMQEEIDEMLLALRISNLISDNFVIIKLGT